MTSAPTLTLDQALKALGAVAQSAGLDAGAARAEGAALAAAVAESAPGAAVGWSAAVGGGGHDVVGLNAPAAKVRESRDGVAHGA